MISTQVKINGKTIIDINAVNIGRVKRKPHSAWRRYRLNCGHILEHNRKKGALCMMIQMAGHAIMCAKQSDTKKELSNYMSKLARKSVRAREKNPKKFQEHMELIASKGGKNRWKKRNGPSLAT